MIEEGTTLRVVKRTPRPRVASTTYCTLMLGSLGESVSVCGSLARRPSLWQACAEGNTGICKSLQPTPSVAAPHGKAALAIRPRLPTMPGSGPSHGGVLWTKRVAASATAMAMLSVCLARLRSST